MFNFRLLIIHLITCILFSTLPSQTSNLSAALPEIIKSYVGFLERQIDDPKVSSIAIAYVTGITTKEIPDKDAKNFKTLNLVHFFTPSGIHLTAILFIFILLLKMIGPMRVSLGQIIFLIPCIVQPWFIAVKRIALIRVISIFSNKLPFKVDQFYIFLTVFILDLIFGSYQTHQLSYCYSFLFLGAIYSQIDSPKPAFLLSIFTSQLLLCAINNQSINLAAIILGMMLTSVFAIFIPLYFIFFAAPCDFTSSLVIYVTKMELTLIAMAVDLSDGFPSINLNMSSIIFLELFFILPKRLFLKTILFLSLINIETISLPQKKYFSNTVLREEQIKKVQFRNNGYKIKLINNVNCYSTVEKFNHAKCFPLKARRNRKDVSSITNGRK